LSNSLTRKITINMLALVPAPLNWLWMTVIFAGPRRQRLDLASDRGDGANKEQPAICFSVIEQKLHCVYRFDGTPAACRVSFEPHFSTLSFMEVHFITGHCESARKRMDQKSL